MFTGLCTGIRVRTFATVMAMVLAGGLAACGHTPAPGTAPPPASSAPASAPATASPAPTSHPVTPPTAQPSTPSTQASATDQLAAFFAAARTADARLRAAAVLVNVGIGATSMRLSPSALAAVLALDTTATARAIPAGLPPELLRRVLLVYSDLESRARALNAVRIVAPAPPLQLSTELGHYVRQCLANGAPAAARFGADLASVAALAAATAPLTVAAPGSRAAGEVAVRVASINLRNSGCDSCGGVVETTLEPLVWRSQTVAGTHFDGTIGGTQFVASYSASSGWQATIWAC